MASERKGTSPLGVLEFTSALNGESPIVILKTLFHFVELTAYQRRIALGAEKDFGAACVQEYSDDNDIIESILCSMFPDHDPFSFKRRKLDLSGKAHLPSWQSDTRDYRVPFVGTSVAKGEVGSVTVGAWPTGFLEVYRKQSPLGVELLRNDFISALPPGGVHHSLCKDASGAISNVESDIKKLVQSHGQIISTSLQYYYWMAISEWIFSFVPSDALKIEIYSDDNNDCDPPMSEFKTGKGKGDKCAIPPEVMGILMKQRLPEWIDAINHHADQQYQYKQQQMIERIQEKQQRKKQQTSNEDTKIPEESRKRNLEKIQNEIQWQKRHHRDGILVASAIRNLRALCYVSLGTARETIRRLSATCVDLPRDSKRLDTSAATKAVRTVSNRVRGKFQGTGDDTNWIIQLLQQKLVGNTIMTKSSIHNISPHVEFMKLACTLLETNDYTILTCISHVPTWLVKREGDGSSGKDRKRLANSVSSSGGSCGLLYIALRYGIDRLIEESSSQPIMNVMNNESDGGTNNDQTRQFAQYLTRLLKDVREILLPTPIHNNAEEIFEIERKQLKQGFILGSGPTARLLSGEVLRRLTKLSLFAPPFDAIMDISMIITGRYSYNHLDPVDFVAVEARRLLFLLLSDARCSPFLNVIRDRETHRTVNEDYSTLHLSQLSKALHTLITYEKSPSLKVFLRACLDMTPKLVRPMFRILNLSDPRPNFQTLSSISLVEFVVRNSPSPGNMLVSNLRRGHQINSNTKRSQLEKLCSPDAVVSVVVPPCASKILLSKIVQSQSTLVVSSGLKLIITILRRADEFISYLKNCMFGGKDEKIIQCISEAIMRQLPQMSLLLFIPTRFDPFKASSPRANAVVVLELCKALQIYANLDPSQILTIKFDWIKLIPFGVEPDSRHFFIAEPLLQNTILESMITISKLGHLLNTKMLAHVMMIMTVTNVPEVYFAAKELASLMLQNELFAPNRTSLTSARLDQDTISCQKYECSLWVDGVSTDTIKDLTLWMGKLHQQRAQHKIFISQAWSISGIGCEIPGLRCSLFLSLLLTEIFRNEGLSVECSNLLVQIATKILLYQRDVRPLASIIQHSSAGKSYTNVKLVNLLNFAKAILRNDENRVERLNSLLSTAFTTQFTCVVQLTPASSDYYHLTDAPTLRNCLSLLRIQGENAETKAFLRRIFARSFQIREIISDLVTLISAAVVDTKVLDHLDIQFLLIFLLSFKRSDSCRSTETGSQVSLLVSSIENDSRMCSPLDNIGLGLASLLLHFSTSSPSTSRFLDYVWKYALIAIQSDSPYLGRLKEFLLTILLKAIPSGKNPSQSELPLKYVFDIWAALSQHLESKLSVELCLQLEHYLSSKFSNSTQGQFDLYVSVCNITPDQFVQRCLNTLQERALRTDEYLATDFLSTLLEYDLTSFFCLASTIAGIEDDCKLVKLWNDSQLDTIASTFVAQVHAHQNIIEISMDSCYRDAILAIGRRCVSLLDRNETIVSGLTHEENLRLLRLCCCLGFMPPSLPSNILEFVLALENGSKVLSVNAESHLIELVETASGAGDDSLLLLTHAFLRCCYILPKSLKRCVRNTKAIFHSLEVLIRHTSRLLDQVVTFNREVLKSSSASIDRMIIACLKYGIAEPSEQSLCPIYGGCLKLVNSVIKSSLSTDSFVSFTPGRIHYMVVSHSSFRKTISIKHPITQQSNDEVQTTCDRIDQQKELISLLISCVSLDANHIKLDRETWAVIISSYNASTSCVDRLLRRLLFIYEFSGCCEVKVMMRDMKWGQHHDPEKNKLSWEWLPDSLNSDRIRSTLNQFPVTDQLEPPPENEVEGISNDFTDINQPGNEDKLSDLDEDIDLNEEARKRKKSLKAKTTNDQWRGNGDDCRYSPGFILPLILGALETHLPSKFEVDNVIDFRPKPQSSDQSAFEREQLKSFCHMSRKLCDRGGISLALASLSSRCPLVRKVATSICGLFLKSLQMEESHEIKTWRERPQMEMLISSVQRGLTLRRAMQVQKSEGAQAACTKILLVPMLPTTSAIFLAKALVILSRPGDDMYGPINRYFLRLNENHGAFQDVFGLPSFLSFYCSSSENRSRCRIERSWALLLLKDVAIDEFSYQIIKKHHVPELIMTSLDSLLGTPDNTTEIALTIDVLETLLVSGGIRASTHLIQRLGLFSWLHSIISWRDIPSVFPTLALRFKFLNLITAAVKSHNVNSDPKPTKFFEKIPLSNAVIRLCLEGHSDESNYDHAPENQLYTRHLESTSDALWEIYLADAQVSQCGGAVDYLRGESTIDSMSALLTQFIFADKMFTKVLISLCTLPFVRRSTDLDSPSAHLFCRLALGFISKCGPSEVSANLLRVTLARVLDLMEFCPQIMRGDAMILSLVLKCRRLAVRVKGGTMLWVRIKNMC